MEPKAAGSRGPLPSEESATPRPAGSRQPDQPTEEHPLIAFERDPTNAMVVPDDPTTTTP